MSRAPSPLARSVDSLLRNLPRARTARDLLDETERKLRRARILVALTTFAAGVSVGIWLSLIITRP